MAKSDEVSPGGSSIHRYEIKPESFVPPDHSDSSMEVICAHFDKHVGPAETVLHEIISSRVHLDVHIVKPNAQWQHILLYTTGMSDLPMTVPEGAGEFRFAELAMVLPSNWPLSDAKFKDERNYWPVRWLKTLARFPHDYDTWLSYGHTMPNGDPPEPFADNTKLCGFLLTLPYFLPPEAASVRAREGKEIRIWMPMPIHGDEMDYKLNHGTEALEEKFETKSVPYVLNPSRKSVLAKRFGLF